MGGVENWIGKIAWNQDAGSLRVFLLVSICLIFILSFQGVKRERIGRSIVKDKLLIFFEMEYNVYLGIE